MPNVTARSKSKGKHYEILVDLDEALRIKNGKGDITSALKSMNVFYDLNKGTIASNSDLEDSFGTTEIYSIAKKIIENGEVQKTQEYRDTEREERMKRVINLLLRNAVDQHGRPFTEERLSKAIDEVHFNFTNQPAEQQMPHLLTALQKIIPIKVDTKKVRIVIPARFTGQVYGVFQDYKESEEWLPNGDLQIIVNIPAGMQIDFYDKLNSITHGAVISEELS